MSRSTLGLPPDLTGYLRQVAVRETFELAALREETGAMPNAGMQISPEQGSFIHFLVRLTGARTAIEVGTFTGYSALWTALALPPDGRLTACDVSEEWTSVGRRYWSRAGVSHLIDLRIAPAATTLAGLIDDGLAGTFDFAFVDADKTGYPDYYSLCMRLLREGGLLLLDNVFRGGRVARETETDPGTEAIRSLNGRIFSEPDTDACMIPIGDGLLLVRKGPTRTPEPRPS